MSVSGLYVLLLILLWGSAFAGVRHPPSTPESLHGSGAPGVDFIPSPVVEGRLTRDGYVEYELGPFTVDHAQVTLSIDYPDSTEIEDVQLVVGAQIPVPIGLSAAFRLDGRPSRTGAPLGRSRRGGREGIAYRQIFTLTNMEVSSQRDLKEAKPPTLVSLLQKPGRHRLWLGLASDPAPARPSLVVMALRVKRSNVKSAYTVATTCGQGTCTSKVYWRELNGTVEVTAGEFSTSEHFHIR